MLVGYGPEVRRRTALGTVGVLPADGAFAAEEVAQRGAKAEEDRSERPRRLTVGRGSESGASPA